MATKGKLYKNGAFYCDVTVLKFTPPKPIYKQEGPYLGDSTTEKVLVRIDPAVVMFKCDDSAKVSTIASPLAISAHWELEVGSNRFSIQIIGVNNGLITATVNSDADDENE